MPDPDMGERVCAFITLREDSTVGLVELCAFLDMFRLARQKLPERLETVAELPRTASGKVQKHLLRRRVAHLVG